MAPIAQDPVSPTISSFPPDSSLSDYPISVSSIQALPQVHGVPKLQVAPESLGRHHDDVDRDFSLPAQWFRDERIYHMERRAIFSKLWQLAAHTSRFKQAGDYLKLELAGIPYFIIKTKEGTYNAFHNVCRHRAFPLIHKETGSSKVIGCKYHGWSYSSSTGDLVKAPQFDASSSSPNFNKSANGLFKIHTHVTPSGFIFINMNTAPLKPEKAESTKHAGPAVEIESEEDSASSSSSSDASGETESADGSLQTEPEVDEDAYTVPFEEHFGQLPDEWNGFKPDDYEYSYSWTRIGPYNWKTFMDGYQECYHCLVAHPGFAKSLALETYNVATKTNYARHTAQNKEGPTALRPIGASHDEVPPTFTFIFPTNGVTVTDTMWYMMRAVPVSATETRMEYDVFKRKTVAYDDLRKYMEFYEQVEDEDFLLCCATQQNLNTGIYSRGFLHPEKEIGVLFYQSRVREFVEAHLAKEKAAGHEIMPAQPASQRSEAACSSGKADPVCSSLGPEMMW